MTNYPLVANTESYPSGIYVLYYEEAHFGSPHYQSIRPIARAPRETLPSIPSDMEEPPVTSTQVPQTIPQSDGLDSSVFGHARGRGRGRGRGRVLSG